MKIRQLLLVLLLLAAGACYYLWEKRQLLHDSATPITLFGNVDIRDVALGFRVPGRLAMVYFEEGDRVQAGDVLAVLDKQPYMDDAALCSAQIEEARVNRNKVEKPFLRRAQLTRIGAISTEERDDAEAARDEAVARLRSAEAHLQQAMTSLRDTELLAPSNGIILTRVREPGTVVVAGEIVCTLALDNPVWIRAYIDEPALGHVFPGQKAHVSSDSGREYEGHVGFISPQAEFTPKTVETAQLRTDLVYRLRVIVDAPDGRLRQGMPVTVRLDRSAPVVPAQETAKQAPVPNPLQNPGEISLSDKRENAP